MKWVTLTFDCWQSKCNSSLNPSGYFLPHLKKLPSVSEISCSQNTGLIWGRSDIDLWPFHQGKQTNIIITDNPNIIIIIITVGRKPVVPLAFSWFSYLDVDPWRVCWWWAVCSEASDDLWEAAVWVSLNEQDETSQRHKHTRRDSDGLEKCSPSPSFFFGQQRHRDGAEIRNEWLWGSTTFWDKKITFKHILSLTNHL